VHALLGPNGAGKTTTIRILATLIKPDGGAATVAGYDVVTQSREVRRAISLTGQYAAVDGLLTGEENLLMMARLRHLDRGTAKRRTAELLERFALTDARRRRVATYSGGMRRRLDLALSLVCSPPVIFLDEPTTGLDPRSRRAVWNAVRELARSGITILLTTQQLDEADELADRITVIDGGGVIAEGSADQLKAVVGNESAVLFFGELGMLDAAARVLREAADGPSVQADADRLVLRVGTDGDPRSVKRLLDLLERRELAPVRLELHRPSLAEAFLTLTGRRNERGPERSQG